MTQVTDLPAWQALQKHFEDIREVHMRDQFEQDPQRFERFSLRLNDILFDYSKNRIDQTTLDLLLDLARQTGVEEWREKMFAGEPINHTEQRAVQHTALRDQSDQPLFAAGERIDQEIRSELKRVKDIAE
jgi:glucose-6-phosphate isomerase